MVKHIIRRLLVAVVLILGAASLVFVMLHAVPGDPVRVFVGDFATEEQVAAIRSKMGLDRPLPVQYLDWLGGVLRGDLGQSLAQTNVPVTRLILERLPRTLEVAGLSILLGLLAGLPIGIAAALRRGRPEDVGLTASSLVTLSIPAYVSGTILVLIFAVWLRWLPASGFVSFSDNPVRHMQLLILPCVTLASHLAASIARMTRSSVLEVITQDYVRTARAKGLSERLVLLRHVLRNSLLPVTTIVGLQAGNLLGGTVIVEVIFAWPGMSTLLFRGIETRDFPVVQGCVLVISSLFIVITLLVDILNGALDPRVAQGEQA
jgi:peptide/nickel transport system permease protein